MLKGAGAVLLMLGSCGFALSICRERNRRLQLLKEMREMFRLLQNEICYTALPLPEILKLVGEKVNAPFGKALLLTAEHMRLENGEEFQTVWEEEMKEMLKETSLTAQQKQLLINFPECMGMNESTGQANALNRYIEELELMIAVQREEEKSKNKVIMSLGIAAGLFMVIILL